MSTLASYPLLNDEHLPLGRVIINHELEERPSPAPDYRIESEAFRRLSRLLAERPDTILQELVVIAMEICSADSAGISIAEDDEHGEKIFRWHAVAGSLSKFLHGTMPRNFSPCGIVVDCNQAQLMQKPIRYFGYIEKLGIPLHEVLLVPFHKLGQPVGTIWIVSGRPDRKFNREDSRLLHSLATFAAAATDCYFRYQAIQANQRLLIAAKAEADQANKAKSAFLANMSHEIRSPLGAIMGFTELLKSPTLKKTELVNFVGIVERNANHLLRLIDDILDLSKVESGKMLIQQIEFSLPSLLTDFFSLMKLKAEDKGIEFELNLTALIPDFIFSDPTRLRQILNNIVGNAIKFTDRGRVELLVTFAESTLVFTVRDTGMGISEEQAEILFRPFNQADASATRKFGGTGLGLILTRRLAEAMGGAFVLEQSTLGKGSSFSVRIKIESSPQSNLVPLVLPESESRTHSSANVALEPLSGVRILVVEDSPDNQMLLRRVLESAGGEVDVACDGKEGVELAFANSYQVILMDLQMPRMDGYEAATLLREKKYSGPIIALTARAMREERDRAVRAGFSEFLSKPVQRESLLEMILRLKKATPSENPTASIPV